MFFLSSPTPAPPSTNFFANTPQLPRHSTLVQPNRHEQIPSQIYSYKAYYAPHSPSPLRTTRNANLMSSPTRKSGASLLSSSPLRGGFEEDGENWDGGLWFQGEGDQNAAAGWHSKKQATPMSRDTTTGGYAIEEGGSSNLPTPPDSGSHSQAQIQPNSVDSPLSLPFTSFQPSSTSSTNGPNTSQWSLRSRASSPASQLTSHTTRSREERKSRFLDRIRQRRDDDRSDGVGDQVLRMDFVRERRGWEDLMARRAVIETSPDDDEVDDEEEEFVEARMSPAEEYDDLIREFELHGQHGSDRVAQRDEEFLVDDDDAEDAEYERMFREMEILSQQSQSQSQTQDQPETQQQQPANKVLTPQVELIPRFEIWHQKHEPTSGGDEMMDLS